MLAPRSAILLVGLLATEITLSVNTKANNLEFIENTNMLGKNNSYVFPLNTTEAFYIATADHYT